MNNKKCIVTIVESYYPLETGFALAFQNLEKALVLENVVDEIVVLAPPDSLDPSIEGIKHVCLKRHGLLRLAKLLSFLGFRDRVPRLCFSARYWEIKKQIRQIEQQADIRAILVESMFSAWSIPFLIKDFSIPVMVRIHGTGPEVAKNLRNRLSKYKRMLIKWVFDSKYICATTTFYFDFFQDYWNDYNHFMNKYFFVIPNTVDYQYYERVKGDELVLLQLGRMDEQGYYQKGFSDTIQSLVYLENRFDASELKGIDFVSVGTGCKEKEFNKLLSQLRIVKHRHYSCLSNKEVEQLIKTSDVILMPSRCEGMSMFATEALAIGRAFIFTRENGLKDMMFDRFNGIAIASYDYIGFANAIMEYVRNRNLIVEYGRNSRQLFEKEFSYKCVAKKFISALNIIEGTNLGKSYEE